jgi:hypothetical protein
VQVFKREDTTNITPLWLTCPSLRGRSKMNTAGENPVWAGEDLRMADVQPALMATLDAIERENFKKLVQAMEELDDCLLVAARDTILSSPQHAQGALMFSISEAELRLLEVARRSYRDNDYEISGMLQYIRSLPSLRRVWQSGTIRFSGPVLELQEQISLHGNFDSEQCKVLEMLRGKQLSPVRKLSPTLIQGEGAGGAEPWGG